MKYTIALTLALLLAAPLCAQVSLPKGFAQRLLADSLNPTAMTFDHHGNLYLAQKDGRILLLTEDDQVLPDPVLQIAVDDYNERGLSGIALHPDFDQQPWLYAYYTVPDSNYNRISRFRIKGNHAVPGSEQILYNCNVLTGSVHNGGSLCFGPDDKLYIGTGDGAKPTNSQAFNSDLGKILRLNADGSIPTNNPFSNFLTGKYRAIYATGLRNPFAMDADQGTGRIFVADVGQGNFEEINEVLPGKNYGWNLIEGPIAAQTAPPDYKDPFFAYPHADGCAIIGSTVYDPPNSSFPAEYRGKIFFADYCKGYIKALDPNTQTLSFEFATGLKQPIGMTVRHDGSLYYLMRSGIGNGSVIDNTSTFNGTLWKVFYTGSGKPYIGVSPRDVTLPVGENAAFDVQVLGEKPLQFQWLRNGNPIPDSDSLVFVLEKIALSDDGAGFQCIVKNTEGADTSASATLRVLDKHRPEPEITQPPAGVTYKAGDVIDFQGFANDFEDGVLPPEHLQWRIDAHHDTHIHPGLDPVSGISNGSFTVPLAGETSTNTWYRFYLSATDSDGLSRTVQRDIFPETTAIRIEGPKGLPVNVDGVIRPMPYTFESLKRQERIALALEKIPLRDTLYWFEKWSSSADTLPVLKFNAPDTPGLVLRATYSAFPLGTGTGLHGEYFIDPEFDMDEEPTVLRRDTVINFDWGNGSPFPNQIPNNGFTVRWTGFIEPVFSEEYAFSVRSDDGCRLYINDSLIINKWVPQPSVEHSGKMILQGSKKYPIRLEYLEIGGGANIAFFWSSRRTTRALVPTRQLYLPKPYAPSAIKGRVWRDDDYDKSPDTNEPALVNATVLLYDAADSSLLAVRNTNVAGEYKFINLVAGPHYLRVVPDAPDAHLLPYANLNAAAQSALLTPEPLQALQHDMAFAPKPASISGLCWHDANADGIKQGTESALQDITVLLYRAADNALLSVQHSDSEGKYFFNYLLENQYFVQFSNTLAAQHLLPGKGLNDKGLTGQFGLAKSQDYVLNGPFIAKPGGVQGRVWLDENANYFQDLNEPPLPNVTVLLHRADSSFVLAQTTDPKGRYQFEGQQPGAYFMYFLTHAVPMALVPTFGLNPFGQTPDFALESGFFRVVDIGFVRKTSGTAEANLPPFSINLYPNPVEDVFWAEINGTNDMPSSKVGLYDLAGRAIALPEPVQTADKNRFALNVSNLRAGVYVLVVENELGKVAARVIKN